MAKCLKIEISFGGCDTKTNVRIKFDTIFWFAESFKYSETSQPVYRWYKSVTSIDRGTSNLLATILISFENGGLNKYFDGTGKIHWSS